ncbi:hypothetical protein FRX31_021715, partial [Thalictrum thalictroides]
MEWARQSIHSNLCLDGPAGFSLVELDELEFHEELLERENCSGNCNGDRVLKGSRNMKGVRRAPSSFACAETGFLGLMTKFKSKFKMVDD